MEENDCKSDSTLRILNTEKSINNSLKNLRKSQRIVKRGLYLLNKNFKYRTEDTPYQICDESKNVFIVNGGLTTSADHVSILGLFISHGFTTIEDVVMIPGKQYSFVLFSDSLEAARAVKLMSGTACLQSKEHPLYMACISKVPQVNATIKYETPPGLILIDNFISEEEENILAQLIDWDLTPMTSGEGKVMKHRAVRHFGYEFDYSSNTVDKLNPLKQQIPSQLIPICERIVSRGLMKKWPDQLTVNRYLPGQGIPPHVDTHSSFTDEFASLSILGGVAMDFRHEEKKKQFDLSADEIHCDEKHHSVYLEPRSLCVFTGPSRFLWTHGICSRKTDVVTTQGDATQNLQLKQRQLRISFTFRKLRDEECDCIYPSKCDSQQRKREEEEKRKYLTIQGKSPHDLEKEYVFDVYEKIANHFSLTRHKPWPKVLQFVERLPQGSFMLDVGCGNGKYLGKNKNIIQVGTDTSARLLDICIEKGFEATMGNCLMLPFRNHFFDAVICIAVIHHLASEARRRQALNEIVRVLKPGGVGLIYVWAMEQRKGKKMTAYLKQKRSNRSKDFEDIFSEEASGERGNVVRTHEIEDERLGIHENRTDFVAQDLFVPWKLKQHDEKQTRRNLVDSESLNNGSAKSSQIFHRYYHVFKEGEIEELLSTFPKVQILNSYYDEGNWCVKFVKT